MNLLNISGQVFGRWLPQLRALVFVTTTISMASGCSSSQKGDTSTPNTPSGFPSPTRLGGATGTDTDVSAGTAAVSGGASVTTVPAGTTTITTIKSAPGSAALSDVVKLPAGSFTQETTVTMEEGADIVSPSLGTTFGQTGASYTAISPAMLITAIPAADLETGFMASMNFSTVPTMSLTAAVSQVVVIYKVLDVTTGKTMLGVIPSSSLTVAGGAVTFEAPHFGTYQVAYTEPAFDVPKAVATTSPIVSEANDIAGAFWKTFALTLASSSTSGQMQTLMFTSAAASSPVAKTLACTFYVYHDQLSPPDGSMAVADLSAFTFTGTIVMGQPTFMKFECSTSTNTQTTVSPWLEQTVLANFAANSTGSSTATSTEGLLTTQYIFASGTGQTPVGQVVAAADMGSGQYTVMEWPSMNAIGREILNIVRRTVLPASPAGEVSSIFITGISTTYDAATVLENYAVGIDASGTIQAVWTVTTSSSAWEVRALTIVPSTYRYYAPPALTVLDSGSYSSPSGIPKVVLAVHRSGAAIAAWTHNQAIWVTQYNPGSTWATTSPLDQDLSQALGVTATSHDPAVAFANTGAGLAAFPLVTVAWIQENSGASNGQAAVFAASFSAALPSLGSTPVQISDFSANGSIRSLSLAVSQSTAATGSAVATWLQTNDGSSYQLWSNYHVVNDTYLSGGGGTTTWQQAHTSPAANQLAPVQVSVVPLTAAANPFLVIDQTGNAVVAWEETSSGHLLYAKASPNHAADLVTWSSPGTVVSSAQTSTTRLMSFGLDATGNGFLAWADSGTSPQSYYARYTPSGFLTDGTLPPDSTEGTITVGIGGQAVFLWDEVIDIAGTNSIDINTTFWDGTGSYPTSVVSK